MKKALPAPAMAFLRKGVVQLKTLLSRTLYPLTLGLPVTVSIETTSACNAKCAMCPNSSMPRRGRRMKDEVFDAVVMQLAGLNVELVILSLIGEPLLDDRIVDRVRLLSGLGYRIRIVTNASLLTAGTSRRLVEAGLSELHASLNGYDERSHHEMMGFPTPQFARCAGNLLRFTEIARGRVKLAVSCMINGSAPEAEREFIRRWEALGFKVLLSTPAAWHRADRAAAGTSYPCRVIFSGFVVDCDGNVLACCRDHASALIMGNVLKEPLNAIWRGRAFSEFRLLHLGGRADTVRACSVCEINRVFKPVAFMKSVVTRE